MKRNENPIIAIIPARMGSSRFPGKPMEKIHGMPMIGHVWHRVRQSLTLDDVYVATCDNEIRDYISSIGGKAIMTKDSHERCTDRTSEALLKIEASQGYKASIVVMIQGDEPMTTPSMIDEAVQPMLGDSSIKIVNLMADITNREDHEDPNEVKVVVDLKGDALYFSREPIPSWKKGAKSVPMLKQVCIIPFRRDFLLKYIDLPPTPLELIESVDMMRVLEHGFKVRMIKTQAESISVDTKQDLEAVEIAMRGDSLMKNYLSKL